MIVDRWVTNAFGILLIALFAGAVAHIGTSAAQIGYDVNKRYVCFEGSRELTAPAPDAPRLLNATLDRYPMLAFRLCSDKWGQHYYLRTPQPVVGGVCAFDEREVFPGIDPKTAGVEAVAGNAPSFAPTFAQPPRPWGVDGPLAGYRREFMAAQQTACPPLEAERYAIVRAITAAEFIQLRNTWLPLAQSEEAFASVVATLLPGCDTGMTGFPLAVQQRSYVKSLAGFHSFLFDPATSLYVSGITKTDNTYAVAVNDRFNPVHQVPFVLRIADDSGTLRVTCLEGFYVA